MRIRQGRGSGATSEDKWKMVVVSYRDKAARLESKLQAEKRAREVL